MPPLLPELGRAYPTSFRGVPSHMTLRDYPLWFRFLDKHAKDYDAFFYDAALGPGTDVGPDEPDNYRFAFLRLTRLRADAIGVTKQAWTIFEVRPTAGSAALGALLAYGAAWRGAPPDARQLILTLVTDQVVHQLEPLYRAHEIQIILL